MKVAASIKYGRSYSWTELDHDESRFASVAAVLRELRRPGCETGHPSSYFPCSGDIRPDEGEDAEPVAFLYAMTDEGPAGDAFGVVCIGPRGGLHVRSC